MGKTLLTSFLLFLTSFTFAQTYNEEYGVPMVVLTEVDPWLMVIGSDVPTFVLYENGQIIYKKVENRQVRYFTLSLSKEETQAEIYKMGFSDSLLKLPSFMEANGATDQPTNELILNFDTTRTYRVYGNLRNDEARSATPKAFLTVYDYLRSFSHAKATPWMPEKIEVLVTDYSHSKEKAAQWPATWPDLKSPDTVSRNEELYSIYLPIAQFESFLKLSKSLKEKQAVEINGKKFSLSYRLPFPNIK
ncbi:hypothetical protein TH61_07400 [Rufibacter sp. DG15C]|uniref:hypothetical protein n=1 Tax=Rufibacter sp. DG15C TaxID=1379909 RepID=UPI00078D4CB9|nr:hypothetical protein [Rufibacter sp. DG15C]AMM51044.1 hypothetical protein TH61_07400 [Rufibacter sp. DG15C]